MENLFLIFVGFVFALDAGGEVYSILKSIKEDKKELQQLQRERLQREERFEDCVDYGKV